jgi:hypothetical protein
MSAEMMSAVQVAEAELAAFFARWRLGCAHVERDRDLRQVGARVVCESCGAPLAQVKR